MKREIAGFLVTVGLATLAVAAFILAFGCGDGRDLVSIVDASAAVVTPGCGEAPAPDAGADADCTCPPGGEIVVLPACGKVCGLE